MATYDFNNLDDGVDWANVVPESFANEGYFPGQRPRPRERTEHEKAMDELRAMNMHAGFIMTFPLPEDVEHVPGAGRRPRPKPAPKHSERLALAASPRRASLEDELRSAPPRNPMSGRRVRASGKRAPQTPQLGSAARSARRAEAATPLCPDCRNPSARYCPNTGRLHQAAPAASALRSATAVPHSPGPSSASGVPVPASVSELRERPVQPLLAGLPPTTRLDELVAAQVREEELESAHIQLSQGASPPSRLALQPLPRSPSPEPLLAPAPGPPPLPDLPPRVQPQPQPHPSPAAVAQPAAGRPPSRHQQRGMLGNASAPFATSYSEPPRRLGTATPRGGGRPAAQSGTADDGGWEVSDFSYENLLELGTMAVCTGLGKAQLAAYKPKAYALPDGGKPDECSICLTDMEEGEASLRIVCRHVFHHACIITWLAKANRCPVCRYEILRREKLAV